MSLVPKRWLILATSLLLLGVAAAGGWWWLHRETRQSLALYYGDTQAMFLVPVYEEAVLPLPTDSEAWAKAVFECLRKANRTDLLPVITPDMRLLSASWQAPGWNLKVELASSGGSASERLLAGALVRSFVSSYPGARHVRLQLVNPAGRPLESQHLDLSQPLTIADVINRLDEGDPRGLQATLWWQVKNSAELVPVQVSLATGTGIPPRDAFAELVAGPPELAGAFLAPVVPKGLTPRWERLEGEQAVISMGQEPTAGDAGQRFVEATVLTLTEFADVKTVRFLVKGQHSAVTIGPYHLQDPISRPQRINPSASLSLRP